MYKLIATIICVVFVFRTTFAAVAILPPQEKPEEFANETGCYVPDLDRVLPPNVPFSPADGKSCMQYLCDDKGFTQYETCGAIAADGCIFVEGNKFLPYPDCCNSFDCSNLATDTGNDGTDAGDSGTDDSDTANGDNQAGPSDDLTATNADSTGDCNDASDAGDNPTTTVDNTSASGDKKAGSGNDENGSGNDGSGNTKAKSESRAESFSEASSSVKS